MFTSLAYACMWASMRPGMSVRPPTSIDRAPLGAFTFRETSRIRSPSTRTPMPSSQSALFPSKTRALRNRVAAMVFLPARIVADRAIIAAMAVHSLKPAPDAVQEARVHLAAALRLAVFHELDEGIDNHFTVSVPGRTGQYLILPFGRHWSEARASDMIVFDDKGATLEGNAKCELSAWCIHAPIHRLKGANVVLHTHQTWATALNMLKENRLLPATQTAAFLTHQIAYDDEYQ